MQYICAKMRLGRRRLLAKKFSVIAQKALERLGMLPSKQNESSDLQFSQIAHQKKWVETPS